MSREKQIEEMAKVFEQRCKRDCIPDCSECLAETLYNAGYRKQSEGEWVQDDTSIFEHRYHCSACKFYLIGPPTKYCENCGAKMKGGAE